MNNVSVNFANKTSHKNLAPVKNTDVIKNKENKAIPAKASTPSFQGYYNNTNFIPFKGNAKKITNACIITGEEKDLPLLVTKKNDSYVVEFDSQTEIIYGVDAIRYLKKMKKFNYDTQIIFPKKSHGEITLENGKTIKAAENSAILINEGTKAQVDSIEGYPFVIVSKKDFDWYERHGAQAKDRNIKNKFLELMYYNSHLYNGDFTPDILLSEKMLDEKFLKSLGIDKWENRNKLVDEIYKKKDLLTQEDCEFIEKVKNILDKLKSTSLTVQQPDGYIKFRKTVKLDYLIQQLEKHQFSKEEIEMIKPIAKQAFRAHLESKVVCRNLLSYYDEKLVDKMKERGLLYDNQKDKDKFIYWRKYYGNETDLRNDLIQHKFSKRAQNLIIKSWKKANLTGFDVTGLKFINDDIAIYNLDDKLNNWTQKGTNWVSNSTAMTSSKGKSPFIGTSLVQTDENRVISMGELREEEHLHSHPNRKEKRQTEVYLITSGAAALNVVKNGKTGVKILKEGELAVVGPGVEHCVNSVLGEYEHIVVQIPSAFQYGFSFKEMTTPPDDYDSKRLTNEAFEILGNLK